MGKRKIVANLQATTPKQRKRFRQFLASPYFNTNKRLLLLFDCLSKQTKDFQDDEIQSVKIWEAIHKHKPYNNNALKLLFNRLLKLLDKFHTYEMMQSQADQYGQEGQFAYEIYKAMYYGSNGDYKELLQFRDGNKKKRQFSEDYFMKSFLIEREIQRIQSFRMSDAEQAKLIDLPGIINLLDKSYVILRTIYLFQVVGMSHAWKDKSLMEEVNFELPSFPIAFEGLEKEVYKTWSTALEFIQHKESEKASIIKHQIFTHPQIFSTNDKHNFCAVLQNDIAQNKTFNRFERRLKLLELYRYQEREKAFNDYNLTALSFWNMVNVSIELGQLNWLSVATLDRGETFKDGSSSIYRAKQQLMKGEYDSASSTLEQARLELGQLGLNEETIQKTKEAQTKALKLASCYRIEIQLLYEQGMVDEFFNSYSRFATFLVKGKKFHHVLPESIRDMMLDANKHFNNISRALVRFPVGAWREEKIKNYHRIAQKLFKEKTIIYEIEWLQDKIERILPRDLQKPLCQYRSRLKTSLSECLGIRISSKTPKESGQQHLKKTIQDYSNFLDRNSHEIHPKHSKSLYAMIRLAHTLQIADQTAELSKLEKLETEVCQTPLLMERTFLLRCINHTKASLH